jgi:hypothetical protein
MVSSMDPNGSPPSNARLADYHKNPAYERRVVIFYDVLGWRNHILAAGDDVAKIGKLRRLILQHARNLPLRGNLDIKVSTFSDNIVVSQSFDLIKTPMLIQLMAIIQAGAAVSGFLIRGGITIGDIIHDEECVFGPGLNRAYELESKIARFPRFVLDQQVEGGFGDIGDLAVVEDGIRFLDPFRLAFMDFLTGDRKKLSSELLVGAGLPDPPNKIKGMRRDHLLGAILAKLEPQIRGPIGDKEWEKLAWLYDRIAVQLGVARAASYPRIRPTE